MNCPICNNPLICARCTGKKGGKSKNPRKGFGNPAVLAKALETRKAKREAKVKVADQVINGKTYGMWGGIVDAKERFIGGKLTEIDYETTTTKIKDISLEPIGKDSAQICVHGEDWDMVANVKYHGIGAVEGGFSIHGTYGGACTWIIKEKEAK